MKIPFSLKPIVSVITAVAACLSLGLVAPVSVRAESGETNVISVNTTTNLAVIGNGGSANVWSVQPGVALVFTNTSGPGTTFALGSGAGGSNNALYVNNSGASLAVVGYSNLFVGVSGGANNALVFSGGSLATLTNSIIGFGANTRGNSVLVADAGTAVTNLGSLTVGLGNGAEGNRLTVSNRATAFVSGVLSLGSATNSNGRIDVLDGATLKVGGNLQLGNPNNIQGSTNNVILVSGGVNGTNATLYVNGTLRLGDNTGYNTLIVSNGGVVIARSSGSSLGSGGGSAKSDVIYVTGPGSLLSIAGGFQVGAANAGSSNNQVIVTDGGAFSVGGALTVKAYGLGNVISNAGGIFEWDSTAPTLTANFGQVAVNSGTVSFTRMTNANIMGNQTGTLTNILFSGNNTFRLNAASNAVGLIAYNFDSVVNTGSPTNYQTLALTGNNPLWRSAALTVNSGGELLVTNSAGASIAAVFTNLGSVRVVNSTVTYRSNVVLSGTYVSDPSTNVFASTLTVAPSGSLLGSNGDLFVFMQDFINESTNQAQFSLSAAAVLFTNSANHLLSVSNSGSLNIGQGYTNFAQVASNFAIGQLSIASGDRVTLSGTRGSLTNALYVGWLDLQGVDTNSYASLTNGIFGALNLPDINLYYDKYDPNNAYLGGAAYDLWGGNGVLLPIPEPAVAVVLGGGLALLILTRRRKGI